MNWFTHLLIYYLIKLGCWPIFAWGSTEQEMPHFRPYASSDLASVRTYPSELHICSAAFITKYWLVTSAKCVYSAQSSDVFIHAYSSHLIDSNRYQSHIFHVNKLIPHANFERFPQQNDIGLIEITKPANWAKIFSLPYNFPITKSLNGYAYQWRFSPDKTDYYLHKRSVVTMSNAMCSLMLQQYVSCQEICIKNTDMVTMSRMDEGSVLGADDENNYSYILGMFVREGLPFKEKTEIYQSIVPFMSWINEKISDASYNPATEPIVPDTIKPHHTPESGTTMPPHPPETQTTSTYPPNTDTTSTYPTHSNTTSAYPPQTETTTPTYIPVTHTTTITYSPYTHTVSPTYIPQTVTTKPSFITETDTSHPFPDIFTTKGTTFTTTETLTSPLSSEYYDEFPNTVVKDIPEVMDNSEDYNEDIFPSNEGHPSGKWGKVGSEDREINSYDDYNEGDFTPHVILTGANNNERGKFSSYAKGLLGSLSNSGKDKNNIVSSANDPSSKNLNYFGSGGKMITPDDFSLQTGMEDTSNELRDTLIPNNKPLKDFKGTSLQFASKPSNDSSKELTTQPQESLTESTNPQLPPYVPDDLELEYEHTMEDKWIPNVQQDDLFDFSGSDPEFWTLVAHGTYSTVKKNGESSQNLTTSSAK